MRAQGRRNGVPKDQNTRRVGKSSFIKQDGVGSSVPPTPGLGARVKGLSVPFRPRPRGQSSGPCPGCSPRTLRTCRCPRAWPGEWSASWWYCRSRRTPWQGGGERGGRAAVRLRAPGARLVSQLWSSPRVPRPRPTPARVLGPVPPQR